MTDTKPNPPRWSPKLDLQFSRPVPGTPPPKSSVAVGLSFEEIQARKEPRGCRWIHGDPPEPDWVYCQRPHYRRPNGRVSDYCYEHHMRSYPKSLNAKERTPPATTPVGARSNT